VAEIAKNSKFLNYSLSNTLSFLYQEFINSVDRILRRRTFWIPTNLLLSMSSILMQITSKAYLLFLIELHCKALKPSVSFVSKIPMSIYRKLSNLEGLLYQAKRDIASLQGMVRERQHQPATRGFFTPQLENSWFVCIYLVISYKKLYGGGRDWLVRKREATWDTPGAAVHRHILYRMNAINDSLKKKNSMVVPSSFL